jgi:hypothetical protein
MSYYWTSGKSRQRNIAMGGILLEDELRSSGAPCSDNSGSDCNIEDLLISDAAKSIASSQPYYSHQEDSLLSYQWQNREEYVSCSEDTELRLFKSKY